MRKIAADRNYYRLKKMAEPEEFDGRMDRANQPRSPGPSVFGAGVKPPEPPSEPIGSDRYNRQTGKLTLEDLNLRDKSGTPIMNPESFINPYDPFGKSTFNDTGAIVRVKDNPRITNWDPIGDTHWGSEMSFIDQNGSRIYGTLRHFSKEHQAGIVWERTGLEKMIRAPKDPVQDLPAWWPKEHTR